MLIEQVIFEIDNFIVQLFDKFTGVIRQRIAGIDQPRTAVDRPGPLFQIVDHIIQRQHFALPGGDNQTFIHIKTHGDQLIRALVGAAIDAAQRNQRALPETADARSQALPGQRVAHAVW
ncbi:hypothetical protein D3C72_1921610 [compost metagenome]